ncbi:MAG TPA: DUF1501 domain-containing protein [Pirellulales bacterium]|nr:DUF1501 domain-containing protein [Pirellulales bacterium]
MRDFALAHGQASRREFMQASAAVALTAGARPSLRSRPARACITLFLVGSPGQLDTWDLKPQAPAEVRGPFRPIATNVPGLEICEHFPQMARLADRYALVRSLHHAGPPLHETGQRLQMTGRDFGVLDEAPYLGSVIARLLGRQHGMPAAVLLPGPIGDTGAGGLHGQTAGPLGAEYEPWFPGAAVSAGRYESPDVTARLAEAFDLSGEHVAVRERYGRHALGRNCLRARRLIERGVRHVLINQFSTVFGALTWDMHAHGGSLNASLADYRRVLCPQLDQAFSALLLDLEGRGLLRETIVPVLSEMGRTPRLNARGGRDHHPGVWTNLIAGGPIRGGQAIGASDRFGVEPKERPVSPAEMLATIYSAMGIEPGLAGASPMAELF